MLRRYVGLLSLVSLAPALPAAAIPSGVTVQTSGPVVGAAEAVVNDTGRVVYRWGNGAGSSGLSTWSPTTGDGIVAQRGQPAPGGFAYSSFGFELFVDAVGPFLVNDAGQVAFKNAVQGSGAGSVTDGSNNAIWGPGSGGLALLARYGQTLPGDGSGGLVTALPSGLPSIPASILRSPLSLDDAGRTTFGTSFLIGTGGTTAANDVVLYRSDGAGGGSILAREGDAAPGTAPGTTFTGSFSPFESHAGTAFLAATSAGSTIYREDGVGAFTPLVSTGEAAPGTSGAVFGSFSPLFNGMRIDSDGDLIFRGTLQNGVGGVTATNDVGYWGPNGLIVREGGQAAGTPSGVTWGSFGSTDISDSGIAFRNALFGGGVTSANNTGMWQAGDDGNVILLAREGGVVPGLPGVTFADFGNEVIATNAHEETAFTAGFTVGSGGVTSSDDRALFFADATGALTLLLREGEFFPTLGTLRDMAVEPGGLNDAHQVMVRGTFQQGSFLVNGFMLVTVPEPSTALLLGLGLALLTRRGRARARG